MELWLLGRCSSNDVGLQVIPHIVLRIVLWICDSIYVLKELELLSKLQMNKGNADWIWIGTLEARYGITRSVVSKRRKDLGIVTRKVGNKAFITPEQLARLDDLHDFIQRGGTTAEFLFFEEDK